MKNKKIKTTKPNPQSTRLARLTASSDLAPAKNVKGSDGQTIRLRFATVSNQGQL